MFPLMCILLSFPYHCLVANLWLNVVRFGGSRHYPHYAFPLLFHFWPLRSTAFSTCSFHALACGVVVCPILGMPVYSWTLMIFWMAQVTRLARSSPALG